MTLIIQYVKSSNEDFTKKKASPPLNYFKLIVDRVMTEAQEADLRQKAILIVAHRGWSGYAWKRVVVRFIKCVNKLGE